MPENIKLLQEGKVVILLDKENLIYDISVPEKTPSYYVKYDTIKQYFYENKIPGVTISDTSIGFMFDVNLRFYPDSPELLPDEKGRIELIAEKLKDSEQERSTMIPEFIAPIKAAWEKAGIQEEISSRTKSVSSIYNKKHKSSVPLCPIQVLGFTPLSSVFSSIFCPLAIRIGPKLQAFCMSKSLTQLSME